MRADRRYRRGWKPPLGLLSQQEIRWWLTELPRRHGWGTRVLGRAPGLANETAVERKANCKRGSRPNE